MQTEEIFDSPHSCLERGKKHLRDLEVAIDAFLATNPCGFVCEIDPSTGDKLHKFKFFKPIPRAISHIAKDAITNTRDTL